jgi:alpha-L-arabinofuranosidase
MDTDNNENNRKDRNMSVREYHISVDGDDRNFGTPDRPFRNIARAAEIAGPGDTVTVHAGTYREWVNPRRGGESDSNRITYRAAEGETVVIKGSEVVTAWERHAGNVWKTVIPNRFFGRYNPYRDVVGGDWFLPEGHVNHTGEVYLDGRSLFERHALADLRDPKPFEKARDPEWSLHGWHCETDDQNTTLYANFQDKDPADHLIEINVRPTVFWPAMTGRNYITVRGFVMRHAATQWAPPTALQTGLIGPHWSKGWIIEDNEISDSKCSGISLGKEGSTGQNEWTANRLKHGTQREREVVFRALRIGWNKDTVGSHLVRNNVIHHCEQTGICGHLGAAFSEISDNHIFDIYTKRLFHGYEIGGIKLHAPIDTVIRRNHIHDAYRGMWLDWQTQGTRVSQNLLRDNDQEDLYIEVSHGPFLVDNNVCLSARSLHDASQGGAYAHNLFCGDIHRRCVYDRFTQYHFPHSTQVAGLMTILGGDHRFYNNIFVQEHEGQADAGLYVYDEWPEPDEGLFANLDSREDYANFKLPLYCAGNLYLKNARPWRHEKNAAAHGDAAPGIAFELENGKAHLHLKVDECLCAVDTAVVSTETLGCAFQSEAPYESADGSPLVIDTDYFGNARPGGKPLPGPFAALETGQQMLRLFPRKP